MYSLKVTKLNSSWIGVTLWVIAISCCFLLLPWYFWSSGQQLLLLCTYIVLLVALFVLSFSAAEKYIGIDPDGAYMVQNEQRIGLVFLRINSLQLIARKVSGESFWQRIWPVFVVIYRDQVSIEEYELLGSFAAQQMLSRSEEKA